MSPSDHRSGSIVRGPTLPEPVEALALLALGNSVKFIGRGLQTWLTRDPVLTPDQIARLAVSADKESFYGDDRLFRPGVEAHRLGLAYQYDPFFSLTIARVDSLPHQLEALYDYLLRLPRTFPNPDTGEVRKLFTKREVRNPTSTSMATNSTSTTNWQPNRRNLK